MVTTGGMVVMRFWGCMQEYNQYLLPTLRALPTQTVSASRFLSHAHEVAKAFLPFQCFSTALLVQSHHAVWRLLPPWGLYHQLLIFQECSSKNLHLRRRGNPDMRPCWLVVLAWAEQGKNICIRSLPLGWIHEDWPVSPNKRVISGLFKKQTTRKDMWKVLLPI